LIKIKKDKKDKKDKRDKMIGDDWRWLKTIKKH
jgi:hypothetical protein